MCVICLDMNSSKDQLEEAAKMHKKEKLLARAVELKDMIDDCRNIIRINSEAGTRDVWTEKLLKKLMDDQYELSREM